MLNVYNLIDLNRPFKFFALFSLKHYFVSTTKEHYVYGISLSAIKTLAVQSFFIKIFRFAKFALIILYLNEVQKKRKNEPNPRWVGGYNMYNRNGG